ncbi:12298_t:CDS:1, partial [Dentiscutata heterogama]
EDKSIEKSSTIAKFVSNCLPNHLPRGLGCANLQCLIRKIIVGKYFLQKVQQCLVWFFEERDKR